MKVHKRAPTKKSDDLFPYCYRAFATPKVRIHCNVSSVFIISLVVQHLKNPMELEAGHPNNHQLVDGFNPFEILVKLDDLPR